MSRSRWAVTVAASIALILTWLRFTDIADRLVMVALIVGGAYQADSDARTRHVSRLVTYAMASAVVIALLATSRLWSFVPMVAALVGGAFFLIHLRRKESLGFGDVLLAPVLALYIGWFEVVAVPAWLIASSLGAAVTAAVRRHRYVAFVPWLTVSAVVTIMYVGPQTYSG
jgi:prepilin signal peptidase PulO-like enzyme (type II secretory pathway)